MMERKYRYSAVCAIFFLFQFKSFSFILESDTAGAHIEAQKPYFIIFHQLLSISNGVIYEHSAFFLS